ncbi:uncharacterized protein LOC110023549 [Phalaenopsis equestris]|uniref:uncharacterized protein LOC110023549 n=1 Tax=Phalaenopsis equestris TaxID=78828 RepID=UPI0009E3DA20|nr:uncharacterized protein LOC110023549 [Phalaenopsis equestris]
MARPLSQALLRNTRSVPCDRSAFGHLLRSIAYSPSSRRVGIRRHSDQPKAGQLIEIDLSQGTDASNVDVEIPTTRRLEEAIEVFFVHKSAPIWLPFAPGSSYWIPPRSRSQGFVPGIFGRLEESLTKEEVLSHSSRRGWPSLSYFVDGVMPKHHSTKILTKTAGGPEAQSDED